MSNVIAKRYFDAQYDLVNNVYWCPSCGKIRICLPADKIFCTVCGIYEINIHATPSIVETALLKKREGRLTKEDLVEILI
jgi:hypothetical protein